MSFSRVHHQGDEPRKRRRAKRIVLIFDCCYSGVFDVGTKSATTLNLKQFESADGGQGRVVLTASTAVQSAFDAEGEIPESLFTHFLAEGLETGQALCRIKNGCRWARRINTRIAKSKTSKRRKSRCITSRVRFCSRGIRAYAPQLEFVNRGEELELLSAKRLKDLRHTLHSVGRGCRLRQKLSFAAGDG